MRFKAHMIKVSYYNELDENILPKELKSEGVYCILKIKDIVILDERDYEKGTVLGYQREEGWVINTHYRGEGKYSPNDFYQIAFEPILEDDEVLENYYLSIRSTNSDYEEDILRYSDKYNLFFDTSLFFLNGNMYYLHKTKGIANDSAGRFYVDIIKKEDKKCCSSIPIMVLPSSISNEDYVEMVEDLIAIREDLVLNPKSKIGLNGKWDIKRQSIEKCLESIVTPLNRINNNPSATLKTYVTKLPYKDIKKSTARTLVEKSLFPYKNKYTAQVYNESLEIYENRAIKYALKRLRSKVNIYEKKFNYDMDSKGKEIQDIKNNFLARSNTTIDKKREEIEKKRENYKRAIEQSTINSTFTISSGQFKEMITLDFNIMKYFNINKKNISVRFIEDRGIFQLTIKSTWDEELRVYDLDLNYGSYSYRLNDGRSISVPEFYGRVFNCTLETKNIHQIIFLVNKLNEYDITNKNLYSRSINILARAVRKSRDVDDPFNGEIIFGKRYRKFTISLTDVVNINGDRPPLYTNNEIKEFLEIYDSTADSEEECLNFINSIEGKEELIEESKESFNGARGWRSLRDKIDRLLTLQVFEKVSDEVVVLRPTQIFTNHSAYGLVFSHLVNLDEEISFVDEFESKSFLIKSTSDIYEIWCLFKVVDILINEQRWKLENLREVLSSLNGFLYEDKNFKQIPLEIKLSHQLKEDVKLNLTLIYEGRIYYSKKGFKIPDYQFVFQYEDIKDEKVFTPKRFYMDAKYRNYVKQGEYIFYDDIRKVAIDKYITTFKDTENEPVASFIIHSNIGKKFTRFGGYFRDDEKLKLKSQYDMPHGYGSFPLIPADVSCLHKFLKMIMEYHLGHYGYCWNCGEVDNVDVVNKKTAGGNDKYHYFCKNCKEFWVKNHCYNSTAHKIIKHLDNYHCTDKDKNTPWYVICPECNSNLSNRIREEMESNRDYNIPF